jgi:hypothetical protein
MDPGSDPDADPGPAIFVTGYRSDLQDVNKKLFFLCVLLFEGTVHLHHFSKIKSHKEVTKQ